MEDGVEVVALVVVAAVELEVGVTAEDTAGPLAGVDDNAVPRRRVSCHPQRCEFRSDLPPVPAPAPAPALSQGLGGETDAMEMWGDSQQQRIEKARQGANRSVAKRDENETPEKTREG